MYHVALRSSTPSDLIIMDSNYTERIKVRKQVIRDHAEHVLGCIPGPPPPSLGLAGDANEHEASLKRHRDLYNGSAGGVEAVRELYEYLLSEYLPKRYPTLFALEDDSPSTASDDEDRSSTARLDMGEKSEEKNDEIKKIFHNKITGARFPAELPPLAPTDTQAAIEALKILGETVEDDLTLLQQDPCTATTGTKEGEAEAGLHRLVATVVCNPSGFDPAEKMGKVLRDIHAPVPSYGKIEKSMERFFSRSEVGKSSSRVNVSLDLLFSFSIFSRSRRPYEGNQSEVFAAPLFKSFGRKGKF